MVQKPWIAASPLNSYMPCSPDLSHTYVYLPDLSIVVFNFSCVAISVLYCPVNDAAGSRTEDDFRFAVSKEDKEEYARWKKQQSITKKM